MGFFDYYGDSSEDVVKDHVGKEISRLEMIEEGIIIDFSDGSSIRVFDDGQSCCESRYATTDDDLPYHIGERLRGIECVEGEEVEENTYEVHETCFVKIDTTGGRITITNHNEHNGYYGGFGMVVREN